MNFFNYFFLLRFKKFSQLTLKNYLKTIILTIFKKLYNLLRFNLVLQLKLNKYKNKLEKILNY